MCDVSVWCVFVVCVCSLAFVMCAFVMFARFLQCDVIVSYGFVMCV